MSRRALSARISADITLDRIIISLSRFGPPQVEMHGTMQTKDRRAGAASSAIIRTAWLGEAGERFIEDVRAAFGAPEEAKEQHTHG